MKTECPPFAELEAKWQKRWEEDGVFKAPARPRPSRKFYCLDMFPYPSADGLHVGHPEGYTATDILCRYKRMKGFDVLHPMGWDAFGLPAENFALQTGTHPAVVTRRNIDNFRRQIKALGFSYDWDREVDTTDPAYYRWTQWIFLKLFEKGLAYESTAPINWCPSCKTGLANEEVFAGACERCGARTERRQLRQWILRITAYADRLEKDLAGLDWPESTLLMQRHWIGRSEGAEVAFQLENGSDLKVFTTRPDTLYGATYMVLAPEHTLVARITTSDKKTAVDNYIQLTASKSDMERTELQKERLGVPTGAYAINPLNNERIPIWIADYVLVGYGTGAIMAVPAHDQRDYEFAQSYNLPIKKVVEPISAGQFPKLEAPPKDSGILPGADPGGAFTEDGISVNSPVIDGLPTPQAKEKMIQHLEKEGLGRHMVNYKLRDWVFSRQRYWGEPIPIIHCPSCGAVPVPEKDLPVLLPSVKDYRPTGTGESPLAAIADWVATLCPKCSRPGKRETNTMPQWAGSCWYYLRFIDPKNAAAAWSRESEKAWSPVDCYVGGAEHAVLHLLYARFWHKVLYDLGLVSTVEPFTKLRHQGMILSFSHRDSKGVYHPYEAVTYGPDGEPVLTATQEKLSSSIEKMSKSKKNVVNPDAVLAQYGADAFRLYEMFMGPFEQAKPWDMRSIEGVSRFLRRVEALVPGSGESLSALRHRTIKKISEDIEAFRFNTAVSTLMIYLNEISAQPSPAEEDVAALLILLHPFAPHLTEELWARQRREGLLARQAWPEFDPSQLQDSSVEYVVQVNGKLRATFSFSAGAPQDEVAKTALALDKIKSAVNGKRIVKTIVIPNRLVNFVIK